jgi:hypothetical protein
MIINKNQYKDYCSSTMKLNQVISDFDDKRVYHIALTTGIVDNYEKEVVKVMSEISDQQIDGIIIDCVAEAPEHHIIESLVKIVCSYGFDKKQILYIDSGLDYFEFCTHAISANWIDSYNLSDLRETNMLSNRNKLFLILARLPKYQRLKFVVNMLENQIDNISVITCGSGDEVSSETWDKTQLIPHYLKSRFPLKLDSDAVSRHDGSTNIDERFKKCLINVVLESCYENDKIIKLNPQSHCWDRLFYTEKTDKCFYMEQVPLFLAKTGYVGFLRKLGFDLFDDIVDHSYDDVKDPYMRIEALANECIRLSKVGLDKLLATHNLDSRLSYNKKLPKVIRNKYDDEFIVIIKNWINVL